MLVSGSLSVLLCVAARPVYSIFTQDPQILALAGTIMLIEIPLELGRAVNMVMCRALQACGDIRFPIVICIINAWLVGVGAASSWAWCWTGAWPACGRPWRPTSASVPSSSSSAGRAVPGGGNACWSRNRLDQCEN